jgi:hypothetical protein
MILVGSRYQDGAVNATTQADGSLRHYVFRNKDTITQQSYRYHVWKILDRIDQVAQHYLGDGSQWWLIMDANPEIANPQTIPLGYVLRIPSV